MEHIVQSNMSLTVLTSCLLLALAGQISGHGIMMDPISRSSVYRIDSSAPPNYIDTELNCGGKATQWEQNGGKCGLCGDSYGAPHPQPNENTGTYGQGKVVKTYTSGSTIDVRIELQPHHKGFFNFSLCVLQNPNAPEPGESCFQPLTLGNGASQYNMEGDERVITVNTSVKLPSGLTCDRCVLRWHYRAGKDWGVCDDGTQAGGCGPQETFRNCADIAIH